MEDDLGKVLKLEEENNRMLKKLVGDLRWRRFWAFLKWSLVIAITLGTYYFVQPYLDAMLNLYTGGVYGATGASTTKLIDMNKIQDLIKGLR